MSTLPAEIIDFIFSFLKKDRTALKSCSDAHPLLSSLAERYLFDHVTLYTASQVPLSRIDGFIVPQLSRCLSERPYLAKYVRSVTLDGIFDPKAHNIFYELSSLIANLALMTHSEELSLRNIRSISGTMVSRMLHNFLHTTHIKAIYLRNSNNFPLDLLTGLKNIKTLEIDSSCCCFQQHETTTSLESLSLVNVPVLEYHRWARLGWNSLASLHVNSHTLPPMSPKFITCSKSLRTLTLEAGTSFADPGSGFPFNLSSLSSLELITIHAHMSAKTITNGICKTPRTTTCDSSLLAITRLVITARPSLKRAVLNLVCAVGMPLDLRDAVEWGSLVLLCDSCQHLRVDLYIRSSTAFRSPLSFVEVVDLLLGHEGLSRLVEEGTLSINQFSKTFEK